MHFVRHGHVYQCSSCRGLSKVVPSSCRTMRGSRLSVRYCLPILHLRLCLILLFFFVRISWMLVWALLLDALVVTGPLFHHHRFPFFGSPTFLFSLDTACPYFSMFSHCTTINCYRHETCRPKPSSRYTVTAIIQGSIWLRTVCWFSSSVFCSRFCYTFFVLRQWPGYHTGILVKFCSMLFYSVIFRVGQIAFTLGWPSSLSSEMRFSELSDI